MRNITEKELLSKGRGEIIIINGDNIMLIDSIFKEENIIYVQGYPWSFISNFFLCAKRWVRIYKSDKKGSTNLFSVNFKSDKKASINLFSVNFQKI